MTEKPWEYDIPAEEPVETITVERAEEPAAGGADSAGPWEKEREAAEEAARKQREARAVRIVPYKDIVPNIDDQAIVGDLVNKESLALIVGASGSTKTFIALHMALCVAAGIEFMGRETKQHCVIYVASEAGPSIANRVVAWKAEHPDVPLDIPFAAITSPVNLYAPPEDGGNIMQVAEAIETQAKAFGYAADEIGMIFIDTLSRATPGADENSAEDMTSFIHNMDGLKAAFKAALAIVHHFGKDADRGARGHSSLFAALDTEISVSYSKETEIATARVTKQRDLPTQGTFTYRLKEVEVGQIAETGKPVVSCVIEPTEATPGAAKGPRLNKNARVALDLLRMAIAEAGQPPTPSEHVPAQVRVVPVNLWRAYFYTGTAKDDEDPKKAAERKKKNFQNARNDLQAAHAIGLWAEEVWLTVA